MDALEIAVMFKFWYKEILSKAVKMSSETKGVSYKINKRKTTFITDNQPLHTKTITFYFLTFTITGLTLSSFTLLWVYLTTTGW